MRADFEFSEENGVQHNEPTIIRYYQIMFVLAIVLSTSILNEHGAINEQFERKS